MENLKQQIYKQAELVKLELTATNQGYQQALGWVTNLLDTLDTKTVNSGPTVTVDQEK